VPAKPKPTKRDAILDAMLDVVVEGGFHDAPMSVISKRAGASAGVIYHHFASKQEIIEALYQRTYAVKLEGLLAGYSPQMDAKEAFIHVWVNWYNFYRKHPRELRFLEQYRIAGFACPTDHAPFDERTAAFERRFSGRSKGGVLDDLPREVLEEMTIGLVERLARQPKKISAKILRDIAEKIWESVRAK